MKFFARQDAVEWCEVVDEVFLLHLEESTYFSLNETGAHLWHQLVDGSTVDELVASLVEEFDVDRESARADVEACLEELRTHGLVRS